MSGVISFFLPARLTGRLLAQSQKQYTVFFVPLMKTQSLYHPDIIDEQEHIVGRDSKNDLELL